MAKAALNQQNETIAQAFKDSPDPMIFLAPEPGYVPTEAYWLEGEDDLDKSVRGMIRQFGTCSLTDLGWVLDYDRKKLEFSRA